MTYQELVEMDPLKLMDWLTQNYTVEIPIQLNTVEDMERAGKLLGVLAGNYAYLNTLVSYAKVAVREEKRKGTGNKVSSENMITKRDAIQSFADSQKILYQAISRMITVKQEINEELHMSDSLK